ncbi:MAG: methyltransferase domain-containing protein [Hyphomonadaceae bacterium]|jgi:tRNA1(Val) A37 N6-methylase TrmN6|nr:methyltransferase domain-containing protein [Hyphomonadaceae bacterium]
MAVFETTEDTLLNGRIRIRQPARGYRVNVDTLLLAATFAPDMAWGGCSFVELGCGVGAALLGIGKQHQEKSPPVRLVGIERDPNMAALAKANALANGLNAEIVEGDALNPPVSIGSFDRVLFNPPYDYPGEGRSPAPERQQAYIAERPVEDWIKVWCNRMSKDSHLTLIHRTRRLREILDAMEGRLGGVEVFPVRPSSAAPARRVIVRARKGSKAPLKLLRGLDLHPANDAKDKYTPEAEAILRGDAFIDMC